MAAQIEQTIKDLEIREKEAQTARAQAERSDQVKSSFLATCLMNSASRSMRLLITQNVN